MHREFDPTLRAFQRQSHAGLYFLTAVVAGLLIADLWPPLAAWLGGLGLAVPTWAGREVFGFRFALIAAVLGGAKTLYGSLERLTEGRVGADLAVAIACIAAILIGEPVVAAEVIVIGLLGECLEAITFDRTQSALQKLNDLFPLRCWVLRDGQEVRVFTTEVVIGDRVVVKPGGKVPVDGVVVEGRSAVDAASLTGESLPVEKAPGDAVLAGCLVRDGSLTIDVKKVGAETVAGRVIDRTADAIREKGSGERLADRLARYFLPAVLAVATLTFAFNVALQAGPFSPGGKAVSLAVAVRLAIYPTLAVLVVACPCPLVLATPAAVIAALGRLAGTGVLVKSGAALERLAGVTAFAFDKTGTLTEGRLEVTAVVPVGSASSDDVLSLAAAAEAGSEHPLAVAITSAARLRGLTVGAAVDFRAHPGAGVTAKVDGTPVIVGTRRFLETQQIIVPPEFAATLEENEQTVLYVARGGVLVGGIAAADRLRPEAAGVLAELKELGMAPLALLTGDREAVAKAIAERLPLTEVHADLLPDQKADWVAGQKKGSVAFVGDGVNDAPALAMAAVGLALGSGTDIAAAAGDVVLLGDPLRSLPLLVRLSRETTRVIRQNIIGFGFGVNLAGVFITGWLWPLFAPNAEWFEKAPLAGVIFHQIGSFAVLVNAMRLLAFERSGGRAIRGVRERVRTADRWLNTLHPEELFHELAHRWKAVLGVVALLALIVWSLSGLTQIEANEVGIVQRFGAVRDDLQPGLHLRWPWSIETVTKIRPAEVRGVEVGFRVLSDEKLKQFQQARIEQQKLRRPGASASDPGLTWAAAHAEGIQRLTDESLLITGDGNLVELLATVRFTISDPRQFVLGVRDVDAIVRSAAESVFRELAAGQPFLDLLTSNRTAFETAARSRLKERLIAAVPTGLGIELQGLTVHDLHPPQEVVASYHAVAESIQKRDKSVNDAEAEATRARRRSEEQSFLIVRQAEATAAKKAADATAARDTFLAWAGSRSTLPKEDEAKLTAERDARIKSGEDAGKVQRDIDARTLKLLDERRALTDFRLYLDAVVIVLRGREKILIDVEKFPGKRHLLLMDPDAAPKLPPVAFPPRVGEIEPKVP